MCYDKNTKLEKLLKRYRRQSTNRYGWGIAGFSDIKLAGLPRNLLSMQFPEKALFHS